MKLDMDCVRDILLTIEKQTESHEMFPDNFCKLLPKYDQAEIIYCCEKLYEGGYIHMEFSNSPVFHFSSIVSIGDLTFKGHEFLADIKPKSTWDKFSSIFKQGGSASFKTIANVAVDLGTEVLKAKLFLKS